MASPDYRKALVVGTPDGSRTLDRNTRMAIQTHPAARISVEVQKKAMSQVTVGAVH
jgi:hypothetical protein